MPTRTEVKGDKSLMDLAGLLTKAEAIELEKTIASRRMAPRKRKNLRSKLTI